MQRLCLREKQIYRRYAAGDQCGAGHHPGQYRLFAVWGRGCTANDRLRCIGLPGHFIQCLCKGALRRRHGTVHEHTKERQLDQQCSARKRQQGSSAGKADTKNDTIEQQSPAQQHQSGAHGSGQHPAQCQRKQLPGAAAQNPQALCKCTAKVFALQQKFWQHHKPVQQQCQHKKHRQCKQQAVGSARLQQPPEIFRHGKLGQMIRGKKKVRQRDQGSAIQQQWKILRQKHPHKAAKGIPEHRTHPQRLTVPHPRQ